jgi:hypothetical protein
MESQSSQVQFMAKALFIGGFEQPGPKMTMNFNRGSNDPTRPRIPGALLFR